MLEHPNLGELVEAVGEEAFVACVAIEADNRSNDSDAKELFGAGGIGVAPYLWQFTRRQGRR